MNRQMNLGLVHRPQILNNLGLMVRPRTAPSQKSKQIDSEGEMVGEGFADVFKSVASKAIKTGQFLARHKDTIADASIAIGNILPQTDPTGRSGFRGEKHGLLKLPNGKFGRANYMGPNTSLIKRLARGDPGRTGVDKLAKAHDIRYALAKTVKDVRDADNIMIKGVNKLAKTKGDSRFNIAQAKLVQAKVGLEDLGAIKEASFSGVLSKKDPTPEEQALLKSNLKGLGLSVAGGASMLPGDILKMKLLKQMSKGKKSKTMKSKGKSGGFIFSLSAIIAALTAAATSTVGTAFAAGAAGAAGSAIVNKIVGGGIQSKLKTAVKKVKLGLKDLPTDAKVQLKKSFEELKAKPTKETLKKVGKDLMPHFVKAVVDKASKKVGLSGSGLKLSGGAAKDKKHFVSKFVKEITT